MNLFSRMFGSSLLLKITLPYVTLALALALAAVYVVARMEARNIADAFGSQLADARLRVSDSVVRAEEEQVAHARTLARTAGLGAAIRAGDAATVRALVEPYAGSQGIERTLVLGNDGRTLARVQAEADRSPTDPAEWAPAAAVLSGASDPLGDKFVGLVDDGGTAVLYTATPVYDGATQIGALLVGTPVSALAERWRAATLADVTLYSPQGTPLATSLGDQLPQTLEQSPDSAAVLQRDLQLGSREYTEVVSPLVLRNNPTPQLLGVSLARTGQVGIAQEAQLLLLLIFAVGIVMAVLLGAALSGLITRPVSALVKAAEGITAGNLDQEVQVRSSDEIGTLARSFNQMLAGLRERARIHDLLGRFVSTPVAQLVLSRPLDLSGELKTLSILFTDLRDFTTFSEQEEPTTVIEGLNAYFQIVVDAAERHGGVVNKFGGDSTLVLFGLLGPANDPTYGAYAAVQAAQEIRDGLRALNHERALSGEPLLLACIGVNTGTAVAGLIGTERRMEYTVIGDSVNLSARIQALNRELNSEILISQATYEALGSPLDLPVTDYGVHQVKGKRNGVRVYAIEEQEVAHAVQA
ncbi:MAG TPA: adenylate/guanylate cyclase domain-containing protein [Roseiflexaceae bacterium]|nr:adenylate/guanylate cyclase domain-containing protein [Roseiflexaceae bacterium]